MTTIYLVPLVDFDSEDYKVARLICLEHGGCYVAAPLAGSKVGARMNGRFKFSAGYAFGNEQDARDCEIAIARAFTRDEYDITETTK